MLPTSWPRISETHCTVNSLTVTKCCVNLINYIKQEAWPFPSHFHRHARPAFIQLWRPRNTDNGASAPIVLERVGLLDSLSGQVARGHVPAGVPSNVARLRSPLWHARRLRRLLHIQQNRNGKSPTFGGITKGTSTLVIRCGHPATEPWNFIRPSNADMQSRFVRRESTLKWTVLSTICLQEQNNV